MANEEKFGLNDVQMKRIEGETIDGAPAFSMAVHTVPSAPIESLIAGNGIATGTVNYAQQSGEIDTPAGYTGAILFFDLFTLPASGSIAVFVDAKSPIDGQYSAYYQSAYIPATGSVASVRKYLLYPGAVDDSANLTGVDRKPIPSQWRLRTAVTGGSGSWGYGLGYQFVD